MNSISSFKHFVDIFKGRRPLNVWSILIGLLWICNGKVVMGATSTWNGAVNQNFNTSSNWTAGVPTDNAGFSNAAPFSVNVSTHVALNSVTFNGGGSSYAINVLQKVNVDLNGAGVVNNSSNGQTFNIVGGTLNFNNTSVAGNAVYNLSSVVFDRGIVNFNNSSSASNATLNV